MGPVARVIHQSSSSLISYLPGFIPAARQAALLATLTRSLPWKRERDDYGPQERESCYMGDSRCVFSYVGLTLHPQPWTPELAAVRTDLNRVLRPAVSRALMLPEEECGVSASLCNLYPQGEGQIAWHSDEVRAHGRARIVASVSLGGPRVLELRRPQLCDDTEVTVVMEPGSVLLMAGDVQEEWQHRLPLKEGEQAAERISLTMRSIVAGFEEAQSDAARSAGVGDS
eukprot:TRINITY_DN12815_c0_g2_i2.p1 TRINITY_DN12815_c0_g2~~TRINITY_DN12815_c0_g2_i2.p1  ORF type:complete len:228 (-),score=28.38 TRINITY_DN12815_c0_g2_i2:259-942(-)